MTPSKPEGIVGRMAPPLRRSCLAAVLPVAFLSLLASLQSVARAADPPPDDAANELRPRQPALRVAVDPRVELMCIVFRLAGNPEYGRGRVQSYTEDVDEHFGPFRDHTVVQLARKLRQTRGVSYDACMSMAVHLTDAETLELRVPLEPWPDDLDSRWPLDGANTFLAEARTFVEATAFRQFLDDHDALYKTTTSRMESLLRDEAHLDWFDGFFGARPQARFTVVLGLLNGPCSYGGRCRMADGTEDLYCILGVWTTDGEGLPQFNRSVLGTVVHEFCHSYANPIVDRHADELEAAGEKIFPYVEKSMGRQAYGNWKTMMYESLVRASTVRYLRRHDGEDAARSAIASDESRGFRWMGPLSNLLGEYEDDRDRYPTLEDFAPRIVGFFNQYADEFVEEQGRLLPRMESVLGEYMHKLLEDQAMAARRPRVVSTVPADGATGVVPGPSRLEVVFDRPMAAGYSLVGGGPNFPEVTGEPSYDAGRKVWSIPVKLKPDWDYQFMLNSERFHGFTSTDGATLAPVTIRFKTGK